MLAEGTPGNEMHQIIIFIVHNDIHIKDTISELSQNCSMASSKNCIIFCSCCIREHDLTLKVATAMIHCIHVN